MKAMDSVYRILRYLKLEPRKGLLYTKHNSMNVMVFIGADWAHCKDDRRSITGYCTLVGGDLVKRKSKKQHVDARSSAKAEYRAMGLWLMEHVKLYGYDHL